MVVPPRIDESAIKLALLEEGARPRDVADTLAEIKAKRISEKGHIGYVIGCDQVLAHKGEIFSKPQSPDDAMSQLKLLRGKTHQLISAVVVYEDLRPVWRYLGTAHLTMRDFSDSYLDDYMNRNWESIRWSVGGYKIEEEGLRLFRSIQGDHFTIQGLPLLELLSFLTMKGVLAE